MSETPDYVVTGRQLLAERKLETVSFSLACGCRVWVATTTHRRAVCDGCVKANPAGPFCLLLSCVPRLRMARRYAKLSQGALAAKLGFSRYDLREMERAHMPITFDEARQWAEACGRPVAWLLLPTPPRGLFATTA